MSTEEMRQLVEEFHLALTARLHGDAIDLAPFLTEDVRWHLPRSSPLHGKLNKQPAVLGLFEGTVDAYYHTDSIRFTYQSTIAQGDRVALQCIMTATTALGEDYENDYCMLFRVEGGLIAEVWEYFDTAHLFARINPQL